ncbi:MAG: methyl-accepting chemotaxis protein [Shimia sp.]
MPRFDAQFDIDYPPAMGPAASEDGAIEAITRIGLLARTYVIRVAMFSCVALMAEAAEVREAALLGAERALKGYENMRRAIDGATPLSGIHKAALTFLRARSHPHAKERAVFAEMGRRCEDHIQMVRSGVPVGPERTEDLIQYTYNVFHYAAVAIDTATDTALRERRAEQFKRAETARGAAQDAATRITEISRTVRLISLNAAVEAARAGESGLGFAAIAAEIKELSEATNAASQEVRESLNAILTTSA